MTAAQNKWLLKLWEADQSRPSGSLSVVYDKTPTRVFKGLAAMGYCEDIMGTFWKITDGGREAAKAIDEEVL